jgi:DNA-binding beta-propeller fold protein YncE
MHRRAFLELAGAGALVATRPSLARASRRGHGGPLVLATADDEASVVVLDLASGDVRQHIGTVAGPSSIETVGAGRIALVGHAEAGMLSLIEIASLRVRHEIEGLGEPRYAAAGPGGRYAYVTDAARGELVVIDLPVGRVADRVQVGALARHLTITPDGRTLYASLGSRATAVAVIDASDPRHPRLVRTFAPVDRAHDVVVSADGTHLWVTSGTTHRVAIHDARTLRPLRRLVAGAPPQHVAIGGSRVFVASGADGRMRVHRDDGRLLRTTRIPLDSYNVTCGFGRVVTPSLIPGTVTTLGSTGAFIRRERVTRASHDACIALALS